MESKPSPSSGSVNFPKHAAKVNALMSLTCSVFLNQSCFSSSVSSTLEGASVSSTSMSFSSPSRPSPSSSASSLPSSSSPSFSPASSSPSPASAAAFFSASAFFFASAFAILSAFFLAISTCFCFIWMAFFLIFSAFCSLNSLSAFACFSFNITSHLCFLYSSDGSPIMTFATLLKFGKRYCLTASVRSCFIKFPFNSMMTRLRCCTVETAVKMRFTLPSSS
mmetsp:Transcript_63245/g.135903  ORF Transcript_63245/g.135903 Transcript_63245/m.135903 type:complete len:222 (-) Transcript_63245:1075-1740(-)